MLDSKIIHAVDRLSVKERVALLEYIAHSVQKELQPRPRRKSKDLEKPEPLREMEFSRGMLRRAGVPPLSDEEVEQTIAAALMEDYLGIK